MNDWQATTLGEILSRSGETAGIQPDESYKEITVKLWGKGVVLRGVVSGAQLNGSRRFLARKGQLILSRIDARNGAIGVVPDSLDGSVVSTDFPLFAIDENRIVPRYFEWLSKTKPFVELCQKASEGTTNRVRLQEDRFLNLQIPLPPLPEQRRIVARIEELAAKINEARGLRERTVAETNGIIGNHIKRIFERGRDVGWKCGTLGEYVIDDCYGTSEKTNDDDSGIPVLRMGNIQNGRLDLRDLKYLHIAEKDRAKLFLKRGDILVNRTNSAELVGKCAVFDVEGDYAFASYLIRLRLGAERADPRLVVSYINSPAGRAYMFSERKQMTGQANVNATKLKALPVVLPPLTEQRRVMAELDAMQLQIDQVKKLQAETATELAALMPSILDKAFRGEL